MGVLLTNIDGVRAEIMRLEDSGTFDQAAWDWLLAVLAAEGRLSALADARRRMETARANHLLRAGGRMEMDLRVEVAHE